MTISFIAMLGCPVADQSPFGRTQRSPMERWPLNEAVAPWLRPALPVERGPLLVPGSQDPELHGPPRLAQESIAVVGYLFSYCGVTLEIRRNGSLSRRRFSRRTIE